MTTLIDNQLTRNCLPDIREVLILDAHVEHWETLMEGLRSGIAVLRLDPTLDGLR